MFPTTRPLTLVVVVIVDMDEGGVPVRFARRRIKAVAFVVSVDVVAASAVQVLPPSTELSRTRATVSVPGDVPARNTVESIDLTSPSILMSLKLLNDPRVTKHFNAWHDTLFIDATRCAFTCTVTSPEKDSSI